jgi:cytoskeletal protein CcmA (bactofilin family)
MTKKRSNEMEQELLEIGPISTTLGVNTFLEGELEFEKSLQINGQFKGEIKTPGLLVIGPTAFVEAHISANVILIAGEVIGNIIATNKVNILPGGKVTGNIKTSKLKIADGVVFDGNCEMIKLEKSA